MQKPSLRLLARRIGKSQPYLSMVYSGLRMPSLATANAIAGQIGISLEALYSRIVSGCCIFCGEKGCDCIQTSSERKKAAAPVDKLTA